MRDSSDVDNILAAELTADTGSEAALDERGRHQQVYIDGQGMLRTNAHDEDQLSGTSGSRRITVSKSGGSWGMEWEAVEIVNFLKTDEAPKYSKTDEPFYDGTLLRVTKIIESGALSQALARSPSDAMATGSIITAVNSKDKSAKQMEDELDVENTVTLTYHDEQATA
jgi:hypothetical protein